MSFKFSRFSEKQLKLLTWWQEGSPYRDCNGIICHGAVRSGKTLCGSLSFVMWSMSEFDNCNFAVCGKTVTAVYRNIMDSLVPVLHSRGYNVVENKSNHFFTIKHRGHKNKYYVFGGKDKSSASFVQGITLAGFFADETTLMPESFVNQLIARCSVDRSKYWFSCNPEGPLHWFKTEHIDKKEEKGYYILHFKISDNYSLSDEIKQRYETMFSGVFYERFVSGNWVLSEGLVYTNIPAFVYYTNKSRENVLPLSVIEGDIKPIYSADYGTTNPTVYLEMYKVKSRNSSVPFYYVDREYCWDSKDYSKTGGREKTNFQLVQDFLNFTGNKKIPVYVDPAAESFEIELRNAGVTALHAKNDVFKGISCVSTLFNLGHIFINRDNCPNLCKELTMYKWDTKKSENGKDDVVKQNDHSCDALRYGIFSTISPYELRP